MSVSNAATGAGATAAPALLPIPGCTTYLTNGFDPKTTSFMTSPIFDLTYDNEISTAYGNQNLTAENVVQCAVPDQVTSFQMAPSIQWSSSQKFMRTISDYKYSFEISVGAGLKGQKYSASISSSLAYSGSLFSDVTKEYFLSFRMQQVYFMERNQQSAQSSLNAVFASHLSNLPATISSAPDYDKYASFFNSYGTHFFTSGTFGGSLVMESAISKSLIKSTSALAIQTAIKGSFKTEIGTVSGSVGGSASFDNSLAQYQDQITSTMSSMGGIYNPTDLGGFFTSCFEAPLLLLGLGEPALTPKVLPLSALITGDNVSTRVTTMDAAARAYLGTPHISGPDHVPLSTLLTYPSDAILVAYTNYTENGGRGYTTGFQGAQGTPPAPCAYGSGHLYTNDDRYASRTGLAFPVPQGMVTQLTQTTSFGGPPEALFSAFMLGQADGSPALLATPESLSTAGPLTGSATTDGFLLISLTEGSDIARGIATAIVGGDLRGAVSIHYCPTDDVHYRQESMLVPIRSGEQYVLDFQTTAGTVNFTAQWIALSGSSSSSTLSFEKVSQKIAYQVPAQNPLTMAAKATTDGFVVLVLDGRANNGAQGFGTLQLAERMDDLDNGATVAGTSIHFYPGSDTWLPCNTVTLPVPKGWWYQVTVSWSDDSFPVSAFWVPLINKGDPTSYAS